MNDMVCDRFPTGACPWNEDDYLSCAHCGCEIDELSDYATVDGEPWCYDCIEAAEDEA
jgi:hypothetical protein